MQNRSTSDLVFRGLIFAFNHCDILMVLFCIQYFPKVKYISRLLLLKARFSVIFLNTDNAFFCDFVFCFTGLA